MNREVIAWVFRLCSLCAAAVASPLALGQATPLPPDDHPSRPEDAPVRQVGNAIEVGGQLGVGSWLNIDTDAFRFAVTPGVRYRVEVDLRQVQAVTPTWVNVLGTRDTFSFSDQLVSSVVRSNAQTQLVQQTFTPTVPVINVLINGVSSGPAPDAPGQSYTFRLVVDPVPSDEVIVAATANWPVNEPIALTRDVTPPGPQPLNSIDQWFGFPVEAGVVYRVGRITEPSSVMPTREALYRPEGQSRTVRLVPTAAYTFPERGRLLLRVTLNGSFDPGTQSFALMTRGTVRDDLPQEFIDVSGVPGGNAPLRPVGTWFTIAQTAMPPVENSLILDADCLRMALDPSRRYRIEVEGREGEAVAPEFSVSVFAADSLIINTSNSLLGSGFWNNGQSTHARNGELTDVPAMVVLRFSGSTPVGTPVGTVGSVMRVRVVDIGPLLDADQTRETARPLALGEAVTDALVSRLDQDWFTITPTPPAGTVVRLEADSSLARFLRLVDLQADGSLREVQPDRPIATRGLGLFATARLPFSGSSLNYSMSVSIVNAATPDEFGNTPETATVVTVPTLQTAARVVVRQSVGDVDYFVVNLVAGQPIRFASSVTMEVTRPSGHVTMITRPSSQMLSSSGAEFLAFENGPHIVRVVYPLDTDSATFTIAQGSPIGDPPFEAIDQPANDVLSAGGSRSGSFLFPSDGDEYLIPARPGHVLEIVADQREMISWQSGWPMNWLIRSQRPVGLHLETLPWLAWSGLQPFVQQGAWLPLGEVPALADGQGPQRWLVLVLPGTRPEDVGGVRIRVRPGDGSMPMSVQAPWGWAGGGARGYRLTVNDLGLATSMPDQGDTAATATWCATPIAIRSTIWTSSLQHPVRSCSDWSAARRKCSEACACLIWDR
ncbi:MAG: hypothetical protein MUE97_02885 [Phycisphaerales bacterium]|nr:hypothetical protein [Phycisphaerales bacterium]